MTTNEIRKQARGTEKATRVDDVKNMHKIPTLQRIKITQFMLFSNQIELLGIFEQTQAGKLVHLI